MSIETCFVPGYVAYKTTKTSGSSNESIETLAIDYSIGASSKFPARQRQLSGFEANKFGFEGVEETQRFYTEYDVGLTQANWIKDLCGKLWNIVRVDNPHQLNEFLQIDATREQFERENE